MSRSFRLFYLIGFIDLFAVSMVIPLLLKHCKTLGASPATAGVIGSSYGLIQFFSGPFIGKYSDQYGRKYMLQLCFITSIASYLMLGFSANLFFIFLSRIPVGIFKHCQELTRCYIADTVSSKERSEVFGKFNSISNIGFIFGPLVGSYLYEIGDGIHYVALTTSVLFSINFLIITFFVEEAKYINKVKNQSIPLFLWKLMSWKFISCIWVILVIRFLLSFASLAFRHDPVSTLGAKKVGIIMSFSGAVSAISSFFIGSIMQLYCGNDSLLLTHVAVVQGFCMVALTMHEDLWFQLLFSFPLSIVNAIARVAAINITVDMAKKKDLGVISGLGGSTVAVSRFLAPLVCGVAQEINVNGPLYVAIVTSFSTAVFIALIGKIKKCKKIKLSS